jgi:glutathione synthase
MKLAFIIDPIAALDPTHDSSVAMMEAACQQNHQVWTTQIGQLAVIDSKAWAWLRPAQIHPVSLVDGHWIAPSPWFTEGPAEFRCLDDFTAVFMRKDPPVDTAYLYATYILDAIGPQTQVLNRPAGIRSANEKMYALQFTEAIPKTIVAATKSEILAFLDRQGQAVLKPLDGKAGEGILFLEKGDRNLNSMIEISTKRGLHQVMVQAYLPAAKDGDKRIIMLNGEPIGAVNRVPSGGEFRGNMAVGGQAMATEITDRERDICAQVGPILRRDGLAFVGLDVIGGYLTEINVTSPTGIREIDRLSGLRLGNTVIDWLGTQDIQ